MLTYQFNPFHGVQLQLNAGKIDLLTLKNDLSKLIADFSQMNKQLIWLTLPINQADCIAVCTDLGFEFHNCQRHELTLICRLTAEAYAPFSPTHSVGAGAVVINQHNQILMVKDNFGAYRGFKLPGGHVELGEDIHLAAEREVLEETGVVAKFEQVIGFVHKHPYRFGKSNLYFICQLKVINEQITIQDPDEIADAKWLDIDTLIDDQQQSEFVRQIINLIKNSQSNLGLSLKPSVNSLEPNVKRDVFLLG